MKQFDASTLKSPKKMLVFLRDIECRVASLEEENEFLVNKIEKLETKKVVIKKETKKKKAKGVKK